MVWTDDYDAMRDPIVRALKAQMEYLPPDEVLFHRCGSPCVDLTPGQVVELIEAKDPDILDYVDAVYWSACRAVSITAKKRKGNHAEIPA